MKGMVKYVKTTVETGYQDKAVYEAPTVEVTEISPADAIATSSIFSSGNMDSGAWTA